MSMVKLWPSSEDRDGFPAGCSKAEDLDWRVQRAVEALGQIATLCDHGLHPREAANLIRGVINGLEAK